MSDLVYLSGLKIDKQFRSQWVPSCCCLFIFVIICLLFYRYSACDNSVICIPLILAVEVTIQIQCFLPPAFPEALLNHPFSLLSESFMSLHYHTFPSQYLSPHLMFKNFSYFSLLLLSHAIYQLYLCKTSQIEVFYCTIYTYTSPLPNTTSTILQNWR